VGENSASTFAPLLMTSTARLGTNSEVSDMMHQLGASHAIAHQHKASDSRPDSISHYRT
jgi:hypothetical protein